MAYTQIRIFGPLSLALLSGGCLFINVQKQVEAPPPARKAAVAATTQPISADFAARIEAAGKITNDDMRNSAFNRIARDAASTGCPNIAADAAARITNDALRDAALEYAAIVFANRGMHEESLKCAEKISNDSMRNKCLEKLAGS